MELIDPMQYYRDPSNGAVCGWDVRTQQEQIDEAIANGFTLVPVWPLPPTGQEALDICKSEASNLLYATDWTTIPDVADPQNTPYLTNQAEFIAYRNIIRGYAVNPVENPNFPQVPSAIWSTN